MFFLAEHLSLLWPEWKHGLRLQFLWRGAGGQLLLCPSCHVLFYLWNDKQSALPSLRHRFGNVWLRFAQEIAYVVPYAQYLLVFRLLAVVQDRLMSHILHDFSVALVLVFQRVVGEGGVVILWGLAVLQVIVAPVTLTFLMRVFLFYLYGLLFSRFF